MTDSVWKTLSKINVEEHIRQKGNLSYISWSWAWGMLKENYPEAQYQKHYFDQGSAAVPYTRDDQGYAFVMVTVSIGDLAHTETLPILTHNNQPVQNPTSFQVNTSLQRCLAKAIAMHGLGHYIYAGEDLPSLDDVAAEIKTAIEADDPEKVEMLWSQRTDKEKEGLWKAASKGGYFTQEEKTYIRETGYKIVDEDVINELQEAMADKDLEWPYVETMLMNFYSDERHTFAPPPIEELPVGYARQAIKLITEQKAAS